MNAYKVKSTVKNRQIIIDLPNNFDDSDVEVIVLQISDITKTDNSPNDMSKYIGIFKNKLTNEDIDNQLAEETEAPSYIKSNPNDAIKTDIQETASVDESGFVPPRQKIDLRTLIGAYKNKMTIEEIDSLTKSWRDEWGRDFS